MDENTKPPEPPAPPEPPPPPPEENGGDEEEWEPSAQIGKLHDPVIQKTLLESLAIGLPIEDACLCATVSPAMFYKWRERGQSQIKRGVRGDYRNFWEKVEHARAVARQRHVVNIVKASEDSPAFSQWMLSRMDPKNWGDRVNVVITQELETAIERLKQEFSRPEDEDILERALRAIAGIPSTAGAGEAPHPPQAGGAGGDGAAGEAVDERPAGDGDGQP